MKFESELPEFTIGTNFIFVDFIDIKFLVTLLQIAYISMTAMSPNSSS